MAWRGPAIRDRKVAINIFSDNRETNDKRDPLFTITMINHHIVLNTTPFSNPLYQPPWCYGMCLRQPFQLLTSSLVPVKDNTCTKKENETFAANNNNNNNNYNNNNISSNWTKFQLLRKNERKTETDKQSNKTLGGYIKGLREHLIIPVFVVVRWIHTRTWKRLKFTCTALKI